MKRTPILENGPKALQYFISATALKSSASILIKLPMASGRLLIKPTPVADKSDSAARLGWSGQVVYMAAGFCTLVRARLRRGNCS